MSTNRVRTPRRFCAGTIAFLVSAAAFIAPAMAADSGSPIPDLFGQWGRDMLFFEPPPSGPGPVVRADRKADGTMVVQDPCCTIVQRWLGDHASPILKPEAAQAVKKFADFLQRYGDSGSAQYVLARAPAVCHGVAFWDADCAARRRSHAALPAL
jgi:hypothetical protein